MASTLVKVLLVEDEPDIRKVTTLSLSHLGELIVHACASGAEALQVIEAFGPDLVLLDVMMPGMDGPTVLAELRDRPGTAHIPVIFMTARIQPQEILEYKAMGALDVVGKPFDPMGLPGRIRAIWERRHD